MGPRLKNAIEQFKKAVQEVANAAEEAGEDVYVTFPDTDHGFTYYIKRDRLSYDRIIDLLVLNHFGDDTDKVKKLLHEYNVRTKEDRYSTYKFDIKNWELVRTDYEYEGWTSSSERC